MYLYYKDGLLERSVRIGIRINTKVQIMWFFETDNGFAFFLECTDQWVTRMLTVHSNIVSAVKVDS